MTLAEFSKALAAEGRAVEDFFEIEVSKMSYLKEHNGGRYTPLDNMLLPLDNSEASEIYIGLVCEPKIADCPDIERLYLSFFATKLKTWLSRPELSVCFDGTVLGIWREDSVEKEKPKYFTIPVTANGIRGFLDDLIGPTVLGK